MSELREKQSDFVQMVARLIDYAYDNGFELTFGDAYRDPRVHGHVGTSRGYGRKNSLHKERLAVDFNLFKDGIYLTNAQDYNKLGEFWEAIGGSWGGRFSDANHFSLENEGRR